MGDLNQFGSDDVFGKNKRKKEKQTPTITMPQKSVGKPKIIPDHFKKVNYVLDPEVIKRFKMVSVSKGVSVNLLLNEVLDNYTKENL